MSLILDALRKADSERERELVPGLHTQVGAPLSLETAPTVNATPWRWIALGTIVVLVAALGWALFGRATPTAPAPSHAPAPEPMPLAAPVPVVPPNAVAPNAIAVEAPREVAAPAPWPAPERKAAAKAAGRAAGTADPAPGAATAAAAAPAAYAREQLPDAIRGALPPLAVGGSIYSSTPANRSLILDGRLYREGELVANDLVLEEIGQKTAVLQIRGYRFEIRY